MNNTVLRSNEHAFSAQKNPFSKMIVLDYYSLFTPRGAALAVLGSDLAGGFASLGSGEIFV